MSFLGESYCKFEKDGVTVELPYTLLNPDFFVPDERVHESVLTAFRSYDKSADRFEAKTITHLFKHSNPKAKFEEVWNYKNQIVLFTPYVEGAISQELFIGKINIYPLIKPFEYDILEIVWMSVGYFGQVMQIITTDGEDLETTDGEDVITSGGEIL